MKRGSRRFAGLPIALAAIGVLSLAGAAAPSRPADRVSQRHAVEIRGMAFHPEVLEIRLGDTVVWTNRDLVPHTATATRKWIPWVPIAPSCGVLRPLPVEASHVLPTGSFRLPRLRVA
jgi:plastocyanin